jgi:riboflavin transporter FmnP
MKKRNDYIELKDGLFILATLICSYILGRWLGKALAVAMSVVLVSLVFFLVGPRERGFKRFILAILLGAIISYTLAALFSWEP